MRVRVQQGFTRAEWMVVVSLLAIMATASLSAVVAILTFGRVSL